MTRTLLAGERKQVRYSHVGIIRGKEHLRRFMPARNGDILSSRDLVLLGSPSRNFGLCKRSAYIKDQMSCYLDAINFEYLPENSHAAVTNLDAARLDYRNFRCFYTRNIKREKVEVAVERLFGLASIMLKRKIYRCTRDEEIPVKIHTK